MESLQPTKVRQLSEITGSIQRLVNTAFQDKRYWVVAEITDYQYYAAKGHHYMSLVEKDEHSHELLAKVQAAAWAPGHHRIQAFQQATGQRFGNHIQVLLRVSVDYHAVYGLKFVVLDVDVDFTLGKLERQRQETMQRLTVESPHVSWVNGSLRSFNQGLNMRPVLQRIALLVSKVSAGYEDFMHSLENNPDGYRFSVQRFYVPVQGGGNAAAICAALTAIDKRKDEFDTVIILRGGGAQTDFLLFDDFDLCKAVAGMSIPLFTGLGHQRNQSIVDLLAHTALKTPTQVAEHILQHNRIFEQQAIDVSETIFNLATHKVREVSNQLEWTSSNIVLNAKGLLKEQAQKLRSVRQQLGHEAQRCVQESGFQLRQSSAGIKAHVEKSLERKEQDLKFIRSGLSSRARQQLRQNKAELSLFSQIFQLMDPQRLLKRGFAIIFRDGEPVTSASALQPGQVIRVQLKDGDLDARIMDQVRLLDQNKEEDGNHQ